MSQLETNIFPVANLRELSSRYRLYRIRGLSTDPEKYDPNVQILIRKLSYALRSPVTVILKNREPHLVLQESAPDPPSPFHLVRATAYFDKTDRVFALDYEHPAPETEAIRLRFLQFAMEGALFNNRNFWQPSAGNPFFERNAILEEDGVCVYRGYAVRMIALDGGKIGVCVDVQHKYVSKYPIPAQLQREDFRKHKNTRCIYHYGNSWYEIKLHDHTGLTVTEQMISNDPQKPVPLIHFIMDNAPKPLPREVVDLPGDSFAVTYMTGREEVRHAALGLCYPVFETSDPRVKGTHRETILPPHVRRSLIHDFVKKDLLGIRFKDMTIGVSPSPVAAEKLLFLPPDLSFGNNTTYSVRGTRGALYVSLDQLGKTRLSALFDPKIGTHARKPLDRQYLVLPKSVLDSYGPAFLKDLKATVNALYPQELPYDPIILAYNDVGPKTFVAQGKAILQAVDGLPQEPGYGIVMIHETVDRKKREHDKLAAMVMRELRNRDLYVSVIHTTVSKEVYQLVLNGPNGPEYLPAPKLSGKLRSYLRNVAITKLLLTNERWPFVLASPLHADLTIAIDVQLNTACFTLIGKSGPDIRTVQKTSNQKERLSKDQVRKILIQTLREEATIGRKNVQTIVFQRDGQFYASEIAGIKEAIELLKKEGVLPATISANFVEIPKHSAAPFRIFDVDKRQGGRDFVENPQVGTYYIPCGRDGYLCSTGREFRRPGTTRPLHVKYIEGSLPFEHILEDTYAQTCLAWTRPEDCTRYPMTLKLADIRLREHAGGYDEDALEFGEEADPKNEEAEKYE